MAFEVKASDLAGRIGHLKTRHGVLETPALLPVIHPTRQNIPAKRIQELGFTAIMTNAYLARKYAKSEAEATGIHNLIGYDGIVMTDSGGYQVLEYGDIEVSVKEIVRFQEAIGVDIATVLDRPTGLNVTKDFALRTVEATVNASKVTVKSRGRDDVLWIGPIQGGKHLDLLKRSAKQMIRLNFEVYALGSPTEVMETYDFSLLVQMIHTVKQVLPTSKPLHLFGAGHPLTIPLAVALGCDLFDSASYILYAKQRRYMTPHGTERLEDLSYLPCSCPVCCKKNPEDLKNGADAEEQLALHNLYVLRQEVQTVKQAIRDGRLWEHLGVKAHSHPKLWEAYRMLNNVDNLFDGTPAFKNRALFLFTPEDANRPEVTRSRNRITETLSFKNVELFLILPDQEEKPFLTSQIYSKLANTLGRYLKRIQVFFLTPGLGLTPVELSDVYPFSQHLSSSDFAESRAVSKITVEQFKQIIRQNKPRHTLLVINELTPKPLVTRLRRILPKNSLLNVASNLHVNEAALMIAEAAKGKLERSRYDELRHT